MVSPMYQAVMTASRRLSGQIQAKFGGSIWALLSILLMKQHLGHKTCVDLRCSVTSLPALAHALRGH